MPRWSPPRTPGAPAGCSAISGPHPTLLSFHAHSGEHRLETLLEILGEGRDVALVSDAGTPVVSDPGTDLVAAAREAGSAVVPIPGPSAVATALSAAGLPADRYLFLGFLPRKGAERARLLERAAAEEWSVVLFEAPTQAGRPAPDLIAAAGPGRRAVVARELTKLHEEFRAGTLAELADYYSELPRAGSSRSWWKGPGPRPRRPTAPTTRWSDATALLAEGMSRREVARRLTETLRALPQRRLPTGDGVALMLRAAALLLRLVVTVRPPRRGRSDAAGGPRMTIGRLHYDGGGDWYANPSSLPNLLDAIANATGLRVARAEKSRHAQGRRSLEHSLPLHDRPRQRRAGATTISSTLRRYLRQGGFLHADDNYGMDASIRRELARLFPDQQLVEVPLDHPIYHLVYDFPKGIPKIHEHDGKPAQGFGIFLDGRLVVYYSYQTDLGDGWEDPEVHRDPPEKREAALRMGVNLFAYAVGYGG